VFTISGEKQTALALRRAYASPLPDRFPRTPRPITNACSPRCSPGFAGIPRDIEFAPSDGACAESHDGRGRAAEGDNTERNIRQDEGHARRDPRADGAQGFGQDGKVVNNFPPCRKQFIEKLRQSSIAGAERWPCSYYPDRQAGRDEFHPRTDTFHQVRRRNPRDLGRRGGSRARMTSGGGRICFDSSGTSCEQRKESPINLLRNVCSGSTGPFIACIRDARSRRNPRIRPKSAFSRFAPLHRPDLVGQVRVTPALRRVLCQVKLGSSELTLGDCTPRNHLSWTPPLTVMFCDLVGPPGIASKLDAEDWRTWSTPTSMKCRGRGRPCRACAEETRGRPDSALQV
jgi:hypothetical protein